MNFVLGCVATVAAQVPYNPPGQVLIAQPMTNAAMMNLSLVQQTQWVVATDGTVQGPAPATVPSFGTVFNPGGPSQMMFAPSVMQPGIAAQATVIGPGTPASSLPVFAGPLGVSINTDAPPGSQVFQQDPVLGQLLGNMRVTVGFEYLRPFYPRSATELLIPANATSGFPIRGALGNVTQDFAFIPRFGLEYSFPDSSGLGLAASGKLFTLQGNLQRTVTGQGTTGSLNAQNSLSIGTANVLEGVYKIDMKKWAHAHGMWFERLTILGSFGGRYAYVRQDFDVTVTSGDNLASLKASQNYTGFGVTTSLGALQGINNKVGIYGLARGSVLAGRNNRSSAYSTVAPGLLNASIAGQTTEQKTQLIPVGEFEAGLTWGVPLRRASTVANANLPPIMWFRGGAVAQIWGGLGLPDSPQNSTIQGATFRASPLVLAGFTVQAGLSF